MKRAANKIVFAGPPMAGKTTAIGALSDVPVVTTDARASDETSALKSRTTVALDYGRIRLPDGTSVHLHGTPGQERFDYMHGILGRGALGLVLLLTNLVEDPLEHLARFVRLYSEFIRTHEMVVGVTGLDCARTPELAEYRRVMGELGIGAPVVEVDAREPDDVRQLVRLLLTLLDPELRR